MDNNIPWKLLREKALAAGEKAYAPYSKFRVGAALWAQDSVFAGCNVENASFGATLCAERVAAGAAVANGSRRFGALVIASDGDDFPYPCGICRQVLVEFAPDLPLLLLNRKGELTLNLRELLPFPFVTFDAKSGPDG